MKTTLILNCLMLLIPFNALAHPGHEAGTIGATVQLAGFTLLTAIGLFFVAARLFRRRKAARADD